MVLSQDATVVYSRDETVPGVDSLDGLTEAQLAPYAQAVIEADYESENAFDDENELGSGTQSKSRSAPARGTATSNFAQFLRGAGGVSGRRPPWARNLLAAGWREEATKTFKAAIGITGSWLGADPNKALLWLGERMIGEITMTAAPGAWETAEYTGSGTAADDPDGGAELVFYPAGGTPADPIATGTLTADIGTGQGVYATVRVQLRSGETGVPIAGCNVRADLGGGDYAFNTVAVAPFVGHVLKFVNAGQGAAGTLYYYHASGEAPTDTMWIVGQASGVEAGFSGEPAAHGFAYLPESRATVLLKAVGSWSGSVPAAGDIVMQIADASNVEAAGKVVSVSGNDLVVQPFALFGAFASTSGAAQPINQPEKVTWCNMYVAQSIGSPTRSHHIIRNGFRCRCIGSRGPAIFELEAGKAGKVRFAWQGAPGKKPDEMKHPTNLSLPTYAAPRWENGIAELYGRRYTIRTMNFNLDPQIATRSSANADEGTLAATSNERGSPVCSIGMDRYGTLDPWEEWRRDATTLPGGAVIGDTDHDSIAIVFPNGQAVGTQHSTEDRRVVVSSDIRLNGISGDDELIVAAI